MPRWSGATWDPAPAGVDGGSYVDGYAWKGLLHSTEGRSYASAKAAYLNRNVWPHFTVTYETGQFKAYQHISTDRAARALRNPSGGVQTNRARCVQIEIVGTCNPANQWGTQNVENFPRGYLDGIARLMRWVEATHGVKRSAVARWKPYPASFGLGNGVRIPAADWPGFAGWCGHMHAPENDHGDPGLLDITYLLSVTGEDDMTPDEVRDIVAEENAELYRLGWRGVLPSTGEVSAPHEAVSITALHRKLDALKDAIADLSGQSTPPA